VQNEIEQRQKRVGSGVRNEIEESQSRQRSTDGIEEFLSHRRRAEKGWGKECGMHYRSAGGNGRAPILGRGAQIGGSRVRNGIEER